MNVLAAYSIRATPARDAEIRIFSNVLENSDEVAASDADFIVIYSPNEVQLFSNDYDFINERISAFLERSGITYIDPLEMLRKTEEKEKLFVDGLHYNPRGHAEIAGLLLPGIEKRLLLRSSDDNAAR